MHLLFKVVAPTWELNIETYGYGKKRKTYDPDYEHVESAKFKEFERLEAQGYDDELKDPDHDKIRKVFLSYTSHETCITLKQCHLHDYFVDCAIRLH